MTRLRTIDRQMAALKAALESEVAQREQEERAARVAALATLRDRRRARKRAVVAGAEA